MNQEKKVVKISDVIQNQIPEFILSENPNFAEFFKQYYISQEFQGSSIDIAENLIEYKNVDSFDNTNLISETTLTSSVDFFDDVINVESTNGWPKEYGLLQIDNEIITYTGITSTSFTGCIRGFSGISSLTQENNPEFLVFSQTEVDTHASESVVTNLSNLFLKEFFRKIKYQFTPGFEELDFAPEINPQNFISKAKSFYQTKGTNEAFKILFKVLYNNDVKILKPNDYAFTPSDDKWIVTESFICQLVSGDPLKIKGQTLYQLDGTKGSIYDVEKFFINSVAYYKIKLFSGYSNNLNQKGSIEGTFFNTPNTHVVEDITEGSSVITVDSTVGFTETNGTLEIGESIIQYSEKTNNQFFGCIDKISGTSGVPVSIDRKTKIFSDHYVFAYEENSENICKFRVLNVLSKLDSSSVVYALENDPIQIESFGSLEESQFSNSLVYNHPLSISCGVGVLNLTPEIRNNQKEGFAISNGAVLTKHKHNLKTGDIVDLYFENTDSLISSDLLVSITTEYDFSIPIQSIENPEFLLGKNILFRRKLKKSTFKDLQLTANIQDSYVDNDSYYLTTNGFPEYEIDPIDPKLNFAVNSIYILSAVDSTYSNVVTHSFAWGDALTVVDFDATSGYSEYSGIQTGNTYYIKTFNQSSIALCRTKDDLINGVFVPLLEISGSNVIISRLNTITLDSVNNYGYEYKSSKLFKKFPKNPIKTKIKDITVPGGIGVFKNGIPLINYKSLDKVYYGPIDSIDIINSGNNYDLNNPPQFKVTYNGTTYPEITILPELRGNEIKLIVNDSGYDYVETPVVKVIGGNNDSVSTEVKMKNINREVYFNASTKSSEVDIFNNIFLFNDRHRFVTGEPVVYKTLGTSPIGIGTIVADGFLSNDSIYYVHNIGAGTSMRIAYNKTDAINGVNLIDLRTKGGGYQKFISSIPKKVIDEVNIVKNDKDFQYKKLSFINSDVNLQDNIITIKNHGFETNEAVVYNAEAAPGYPVSSINGLQIGNQYYISKVDDDNIRLTSSPNSEDYIIFNGGVSNSTIYFIEYPRVEIEILGTTTVSGISEIGYSATITPVVSSYVVGAKPQKNPLLNDYNFGYSNIVNYHRRPTITPIEGSGASLQALIVNGQINEVVVKNSGKDYYNTIELIVSGDGFGAVLNPIIEDGKIIGVEIGNGGIGYNSNNTTIQVNSVGKNLKLTANIKSWTINEVNKLDLASTSTKGKIFGRQYSLVGKTFGLLYLNNDLRTYLDIPNNPTEHSPIVGWAYDGCPIYGPFAYQNTNGTGGIIRMRSGYVLQAKTPGPFSFVEEYIFTNQGTLDEHNGRFCITPEFPNGTYAYFCTFDESNVPEFPYVIGDSYNFKVEESNLNLFNNQNKDFNTLNIIKNTKPYRFQSTQNNYEYFEYYPNKNKKDVIITNTSEGSISEIKVVDGGINYQIGDSINFNNEGTLGKGAISKVSELEGVGITSISTQVITLNDVSFTYDGQTLVGIASTYHSLQNNSYINISGVSSSLYNNINGIKNIFTLPLQTNLLYSVNDASTTGILTSIQIKDNISSYEIDSYLKINNEIVKIVGLDYKNNLVNILRGASGTSHASNSVVNILPNKFYSTVKDLCPTSTEVNDAYYFNPSESIVTGTDFSVGVGQTLTINPLGKGIPYVKYVATGGIYLPNHKFKNGDSITYVPGISSITTNLGYLDEIPNLYIVNIQENVVGLVTNIKDVSNYNNPISFTSTGTGNLHKFTTNRNVITANTNSTFATVSTASSHGLLKNDTINLNVKSGLNTTYSVSYDSNFGRLLIDSNVNPFINLYRNDIITFDLSSPSLLDTDFNLYTDDNLQNKYFANEDNFVEVTKSNSQLILQITDKTPSILYYRLTSTSKIIYTNDLIPNHNKIIINDSLYNGNVSISTCTNNTFGIYLKVNPERLNYDNSSDLIYTVIDSNTTGSISKVDLISKGSNYKKIPDITSITTDNGTGATLIPLSNNIGKILDSKVNNSKFICHSDKTLKPLSKVFSALNLANNLTVKQLNIIFGGKNYISPPTLKLYNAKTDTVASDFLALPILKGTTIGDIEIANPGYGLNSNDNQIVTENNSNGFKIISANSTLIFPYTVTLTLQTPITGFTTSNPLPLEVGDKIYVENIISNVGSGFNSKDHNYESFEVTYVDPAYGSQDAAIIRYELDSYPGDYDEESTFAAFVTPKSYLPQIEVILDKNIFVSEESVGNTYIVENSKNNPIKNLVKVKNSNDLELDDIIEGSYSKSKGKIVQIDSYDTEFKIDASVSETIGGTENRGYLSSNIQKLSDNDYYQKFSYSLKSKKDFSKWNSSVSDLSHISGYKKFGDLSIESIGIGVSQPAALNPYSKLNVLLTSYVDVNSVHDFDLVFEEDIDINNGLYSQYLIFNSTKLGNSLNSTNNRVLSIDDISELFSTETATPPLLVDSINTLPFNSSSTTVLKYQFFLAESSSFLGEFAYPEMFEIFITKNNDIYNLTSYSYFYDPSLYPNSIFGEFTLDQNPNDSDVLLLNFTANNPFSTVDIKAIKETANVAVGIATTSFGYVKNVELTAEVPSSGITTIYTIPSSECQSGIIFIGISSQGTSIERSFESSFVSSNGVVYINTYADTTTKDLGSLSITDNGSNVNIEYTTIPGIGVTVYSNFKFLTNTYAGYDSITKSISLISSTNSLSSGNSAVAISTVSGDYSYTKYVIEIEKTVGISTQRSIAQINSIHFNDYLNNIVYSEEGDLPIDKYSFETVYNTFSNTYTLYFTPVDSANYKLIVYETSLLSPN